MNKFRIRGCERAIKSSIAVEEGQRLGKRSLGVFELSMVRVAYTSRAKSRADTVRLSQYLHHPAWGRGLISHCMPGRQGGGQGSEVVELALSLEIDGDWLRCSSPRHGSARGGEDPVLGI